MVNAAYVPVAKLAAMMPPLSVMAKRYSGSLYVLTANRRAAPWAGSIVCAGIAPGTMVEVIGENRQFAIGADGVLADKFEPYGVHIYRVGLK